MYTYVNYSIINLKSDKRLIRNLDRTTFKLNIDLIKINYQRFYIRQINNIFKGKNYCIAINLLTHINKILGNCFLLF